MNIFEPSAACFERMTPSDFADVARALIKAEAIRAGLRPEQLRWTENDSTPDGGIDARIAAAPLKASLHLPDKPCLFQFKQGNVHAARIAKEITAHPKVKRALREGHAYRLVLAKDPPPAKLDCYLEALRKAASRVVKDPDVDVWNATYLSQWIGEFPGLLYRAAFRRVGVEPRYGLLKFSEWSRNEASPRWVPDAGRVALLPRLIERIRTPGSVSRVVGPAGAGKTRLVLEAVRAAKRTMLCAYAPEKMAGLEEMLRGGGRPEERYGVLIVDECSEEDHERIVRRMPPRAQLAVITIGVADRRLDSFLKEGESMVTPLERDAAVEVALAMDARDPELSRRVAQRSGGFPRLIRLLLEAAKLDPGVLDPDRHPDLVKALKRLLGGDRSDAVCAPSLLRQVGWDGPPAAERRALIGALELSEPDLVRLADSLARREVLRGAAEYRYMTPSLLAEWLAADLWRSWGGELFIRLQQSGMPERGLISALRRLVDIGHAEGLSGIARQLLRDERIFGRASFLTAQDSLLARFVHELAALSPSDAAAVLSRALGGQDRETLKKKPSAWRRDVVWALQKCAWAGESFEEAAKLLLLLADAENEPWGNNATGALKALFPAHLGATEADGDERVRVLRVLFHQSSPAQQSLIVQAAGAALEQEVTGDASPFPPGARPRGRWRPRTREEEARYRRGAAEVVLLGLCDEARGRGRACRDPEPRCQDASAAAQAAARKVVDDTLRNLLVHDLGDVAEELVRAVGARARSDARLLEVVSDAEEYDLAELTPAARDALRRIRQHLSPQSFEERLRAAVGAEFQSEQDGPTAELTPLAEELLRSPAEQPHAVEWLISSGAPLVYDLGLALGRLDRERALEALILSMSLVRERPSLLSGYLWGLADHVSRDAIEDLLDRWADTEPGLARAAFDATYLGPPSERAADRLIRLVALDGLTPDALGRLVYGGWLLRVPLDVAVRVIEAARTSPAVALDLWQQLARHIKDAPAAWNALGFSLWSCIDGAALEAMDHRLRWAWEDVGERLSRARAVDVGRRALALILGDLGRRASASEEAVRLLGKCLSLDPEGLWPGVLTALEAAPDGRPHFALASTLREHLPEGALVGAVLRWTKEGGAARRTLAGSLTKAPSDAPESLGAALLDAFPDDKEFGDQLSARFFSGAYGGTSEAWAARKMRELEALSRSTRPGLSAWARRHLRQARQELQAARDDDARQGIDR